MKTLFELKKYMERRLSELRSSMNDDNDMMGDEDIYKDGMRDAYYHLLSKVNEILSASKE